MNETLPTICPQNLCTAHEKAAIRAVLRLQRINMQGWNEFHVADRKFDGGEWSDAAFDRGVVAEEERCIRVVSSRFEIDTWRLGELVMLWESVEEDMFQDAIYRASRRAQ